MTPDSALQPEKEEECTVPRSRSVDQTGLHTNGARSRESLAIERNELFVTTLVDPEIQGRSDESSYFSVIPTTLKFDICFSSATGCDTQKKSRFFPEVLTFNGLFFSERHTVNYHWNDTSS